MTTDPHLLDLTVAVVSAFAANNHVHAQDLPGLIGSVHTAFGGLLSLKTEERAPEAPTPAVPVNQSIADDFIICLEDGKKFKSLKRHLMTRFGLTPDQYRAKWGLPRDYPMVPPVYAARRSQLAKEQGLGANRRKAA